MPIYSYRCDDCEHAKDVLQKISDPPPAVCPSCGAAAFRKQVTAAGFQLKGSGWYVTDFRNPPAGKAAVKDKGDKDTGVAEAASSADKPPSGGDASTPEKGTTPATTAASSASDKPAASPVPSDSSRKASSNTPSAAPGSSSASASS
ncbi:MAG: FmdB family zinc ribbon protein [Burkholderiaceae bacterium]